MDGRYLPSNLTDFSLGSMIVLSLVDHALYRGAVDCKRGFTSIGPSLHVTMHDTFDAK